MFQICVVYVLVFFKSVYHGVSLRQGSTAHCFFFLFLSLPETLIKNLTKNLSNKNEPKPGQKSGPKSSQTSCYKVRKPITKRVLRRKLRCDHLRCRMYLRAVSALRREKLSRKASEKTRTTYEQPTHKCSLNARFTAY